MQRIGQRLGGQRHGAEGEQGGEAGEGHAQGSGRRMPNDGSWPPASRVNGSEAAAVYPCPRHGVTPLPIRHRLFAAALALLALHAEARDYRYSDAHLHFVDFFQESEGMTSLLEAMAAGRIDHV